jgi:hypothetical protein
MLVLLAKYVSMNAATCQALIAFFPLVMITLVLERRSTAIKIRKLGWFRQFAVYVLGVAVIGLAVAFVGSQVGELTGGWAYFAWLMVGFEVVGLGIVLMASMASTEVDEDRGTASNTG